MQKTDEKHLKLQYTIFFQYIITSNGVLQDGLIDKTIIWAVTYQLYLHKFIQDAEEAKALLDDQIGNLFFVLHCVLNQGLSLEFNIDYMQEQDKHYLTAFKYILTIKIDTSFSSGKRNLANLTTQADKKNLTLDK